jgi:hypothetical protein
VVWYRNIGDKVVSKETKERLGKKAEHGKKRLDRIHSVKKDKSPSTYHPGDGYKVHNPR